MANYNELWRHFLFTGSELQ